MDLVNAAMERVYVCGLDAVCGISIRASRWMEMPRGLELAADVNRLRWAIFTTP